MVFTQYLLQLYLIYKIKVNLFKKIYDAITSPWLFGVKYVSFADIPRANFFYFSSEYKYREPPVP